MTEDPTALAQQIRQWLTVGDGQAYYGVEGKRAQCRVCHAYADGPSELAERHIEDRPYLWCATAWLEAAAAALEGVQGQQHEMCVRLLRMFEPALSSRIPPIEEVLARAASLVALEAGIDALPQISALDITDRQQRWVDRDNPMYVRADKLAALCQPEQAEAGLATPPYPTREEWNLLVKSLEVACAEIERLHTIFSPHETTASFFP